MKQEQTGRHSEVGKVYDTSSVLQIRLSTQYIIDQIETFITGKIKTVVYDKETGEPTIKYEQITQPKANKLGQQILINKVQAIINSAVVQGNFDETRYENYIDNVWQDLQDDLIINMPEWEVHESDYNAIIDNIMYMVIPFISRLLDNKERDSYAQSLRVEEKSQLQQTKSKLFN